MAKAAAAVGGPQDGSTVDLLGARPRPRPTRGWAGKCDRSSGVRLPVGQLMSCMTGYGPCADATCVGAITDAYGGPRTRARELECRRARRGGVSDVGTYSRYVPYLVVFTDIFALYVALVMYKDGPVHQESTARPIRGRLSSRSETQKSIRDHESELRFRNLRVSD